MLKLDYILPGSCVEHVFPSVACSAILRLEPLENGVQLSEVAHEGSAFDGYTCSSSSLVSLGEHIALMTDRPSTTVNQNNPPFVSVRFFLGGDVFVFAS